MPDIDAWRGHELRATSYSAEDPDTEPTGARCVCGAKPDTDDDAQLWFATHLKDNGGKDYAVEFGRFWRRLVTDAHGQLDEDRVARELFDYSIVMSEASKVYEELAGLSKPNSAAHHVIRLAEERSNERQADLILHDLLPVMKSDADRQAVIDYANGLHPEAYEEHLRAQRLREESATARRAAQEG